MLDTVVIVVSVIAVVGVAALAWWYEYAPEKKDNNVRKEEE